MMASNLGTFVTAIIISCFVGALLREHWNSRAPQKIKVPRTQNNASSQVDPNH